MLMDFPSLSSLTISSKKWFYQVEDVQVKAKVRKRAVYIQRLKNFLSPKKKEHHYFASRSLSQYGQVTAKQKIGTGAYASVVILKPKECYAVKIFNHKRKNSTFMKKLISEFCISSALDHPNIVKTIDLVLDGNGRYCTVMEYCSGGDLYSFIKDQKLKSQDEINWYFKQLLDGLLYLHKIGVAHRDIKPENLLLTKQDGHGLILKIADFGEADVFREIWQPASRLSDGLHGSTPYIAPEVFTHAKLGYYASQADVWSAGIVYFSMTVNGVPFYSAQLSDSNYRLYKNKHKTRNYAAFQSIPENVRYVLYNMLNPDPKSRLTIQQIMNIAWLADQKPPKKY